MSRRVLSVACLALALAAGARAQSPEPLAATVGETLQVTATRIPEDVLDLPASVTVISAEEIAARGATDLASALALATGVFVAPGGDGGPASSVPELMGLREFDAFLLVVDGVPWGAPSTRRSPASTSPASSASRCCAARRRCSTAPRRSSA